MNVEVRICKKSLNRLTKLSGRAQRILRQIAQISAEILLAGEAARNDMSQHNYLDKYIALLGRFDEMNRMVRLIHDLAGREAGPQR